MNILLLLTLIQDPWIEDAEEAVATATERAAEENRRVLIIWGSAESEPSRALAERLRKDADLRKKISYEYHAAYVRDSAAALAARLEADVAGGVPLVTVVGGDGKPIAHTRDVEKLAEFLTQHQCEPVKADDVLAAALARAAEQKKRVLLVFGAPW